MEAFLPVGSLQHVMPTMVDQAKNHMVNAIRREVSQTSTGAAQRQDQGFTVDVHHFMQMEALKHLHLALLGETREFSDEHAPKLAHAFDMLLYGLRKSSKKEIMEYYNYVRSVSAKLLSRARDELGNPTHTGPFRAAAQGCPVAGPVMAKLLETTFNGALDPASVQLDNVTTFSFAGFDTTANLMTWMAFELSKRPDLQERVRKEVDAVDAMLTNCNRDLEYQDLRLMPLLSRVVTETLRLWASIPNGTFRELHFDEKLYLSPNSEEQVVVKAGTNVWIPIWSLHHSKALWGPDADEFNPDREWNPDELATVDGAPAAPHFSHRFAPFMFPPRGCAGQAAAQMEARVVFFYLLKRFTLTLAEETRVAWEEGAQGNLRNFVVNRGTLVPKTPIQVVFRERPIPEASRL